MPRCLRVAQWQPMSWMRWTPIKRRRWLPIASTLVWWINRPARKQILIELERQRVGTALKSAVMTWVIW